MLPSPAFAETLKETSEAVLASVRTELSLGLTFLDVAETTSDKENALRNVKHALMALHTADQFLAGLRPGSFNSDAVQRRRNQLAERLGAVAGLAS